MSTKLDNFDTKLIWTLIGGAWFFWLIFTWICVDIAADVRYTNNASRTGNYRFDSVVSPRANARSTLNLCRITPGCRGPSYHNAYSYFVAFVLLGAGGLATSGANKRWPLRGGSYDLRDERSRASRRPAPKRSRGKAHPLLKRITDKYHQHERGAITQDDFEIQKNDILLELEDDNEIDRFCEHVANLPMRNEIFTPDDLDFIEQHSSSVWFESTVPDATDSEPISSDEDTPEPPSSSKDTRGEHPFIKQIARLHSLNEATLMSNEKLASSKARLLDELPLDTDFEWLLDDIENREDSMFSSQEIEVIKSIEAESRE